MAQQKIINSFFENDNRDIIFFYCGKNSVLGLAQPDHYTKNSSAHAYARIAFLTLSDISDDGTVIYINETLGVNLITPELGTMDDIKSFKVHVEGFGKANRIVKSSVRCTVHNDNITEPIQNINVYVTEEYYLNSDNEKIYGIGIWVETAGVEYILVNVENSLAVNHTPLDNEHFPTYYEAEYLNQITKNADVNLVNVKDGITNNLICIGMPVNEKNDTRLAALEEKTKYFPFGFVQNHIWYDTVYTPSVAGTEEIILPTSVRGDTLERIVKLDTLNKCFSVIKDGVYMLQLKNGFYLNTGESGLDLIPYKNSDRLKEMGLSTYLTSKDDGVIKNLFSSQTISLRLTTSDKIYLKASWSDITDLECENETVISITALIYD